MSEYVTKVAEKRDHDDSLPSTGVVLLGHCDDPSCSMIHALLVDQETREDIAEFVVPIEGLEPLIEAFRAVAAKIKERKGQ